MVSSLRTKRDQNQKPAAQKIHFSSFANPFGAGKDQGNGTFQFRFFFEDKGREIIECGKVFLVGWKIEICILSISVVPGFSCSFSSYLCG